jgi:uncharacterized membrane protein YeiB
MTELGGPVQASDRIQTLDIVRGFALPTSCRGSG